MGEQNSPDLKNEASLTEDDLHSEEYKKQERIKNEREKASRALAEEEAKYGKVNLVYLDPTSDSRVKGFSRSAEAMRQSCERLANFAAAIGFCGLLVNVVVGFVNVEGLGIAGVTMMSVIEGISAGMITIALFVAIFATLSAITSRKKHNTEVKSALTTALIVLIVLGVYAVIKISSLNIM